MAIYYYYVYLLLTPRQYRQSRLHDTEKNSAPPHIRSSGRKLNNLIAAPSTSCALVYKNNRALAFS